MGLNLIKNYFLKLATYRTTAVYGSGKFGLADRYRIKDRPEINGPFRIEMMLVYLVRPVSYTHLRPHET